MRIADKIVKIFFDLKSKFTKEKNLIKQNRSSIPCDKAYNYILCYLVGFCVAEVLSFSSNTEGEAGSVRSELKRKNNSCITPEAVHFKIKAPQINEVLSPFQCAIAFNRAIANTKRAIASISLINVFAIGISFIE